MTPFEPGGRVLVTDGGLATELEARGHDLSDALWSARLLMDAPGAIAAAAGATGKPVIVYPNSGEGWDAGRRAWAGRAQYAGQPRHWLAAGASIIGGCCRVRPADIAQIARTVAAARQA